VAPRWHVSARRYYHQVGGVLDDLAVMLPLAPRRVRDLASPHQQPWLLGPGHLDPNREAGWNKSPVILNAWYWHCSNALKHRCAD
jgi:hypothetical protein